MAFLTGIQKLKSFRFEVSVKGNDILCSGTQLGSLGLATVMINTAPVADPGFQVYKIYTELYLSIRFLNSVSVGPPMSVFMYVFLLKLSDLTGSVSR